MRRKTYGVAMVTRINSSYLLMRQDEGPQTEASIYSIPLVESPIRYSPTRARRAMRLGDLPIIGILAQLDRRLPQKSVLRRVTHLGTFDREILDVDGEFTLIDILAIHIGVDRKFVDSRTNACVRRRRMVSSTNNRPEQRIELWSTHQVSASLNRIRDTLSRSAFFLATRR